MGIRRLFYIGGVIPTILGGGISGWWFGKDKTIKDALERIGKVPFKTEAEFEKVYKKYKDSDGFKSNIPNAVSWKDISKWCETKLSLELNEENIKKVFDKVLKYCTEFQETEIESKKLSNFEGLMSIIDDNTRKNSVKATSILSFAYDGNYYCAKYVDAINNETQFEKCDAPRNYYSLYVTPYGPLNKYGTSSLWEKMFERYFSRRENPLGINLKSISRGDYDHNGRQHIMVEVWNNSLNQNALAGHCANLLRKPITSKEEYRKSLVDFVTWCTETGLDDRKLSEFHSKIKES